MFHRSERLLLRPGWLEDAVEVTARIGDERIVRNLSRVPWPYREEDAREWLALPRDPLLPRFLLTLPGVRGTPIIGACGLHLNEGRAEIGYWVASDWWGQGYATEAARAVLAVSRALGHREVMGRHAVDNPASGKVLRKAGFRPTGKLHMIHSRGRGADVAAAEFQIDLGAAVGGDDPSMMPKAA